MPPPASAVLELKIVANGPGIDLFRAGDAELAGRLAALRRDYPGVSFVGLRADDRAAAGQGPAGRARGRDDRRHLGPARSHRAPARRLDLRARLRLASPPELPAFPGFEPGSGRRPPICYHSPIRAPGGHPCPACNRIAPGNELPPAMRATLPLLLDTDFPPLARRRLEAVQVNLGYVCNQSCLHCHVNAGPTRTESMSAETIDAGARLPRGERRRHARPHRRRPRAQPALPRASSARARALGVQVIDRCNLTILEEPGQEDLAEFLAAHRRRGRRLAAVLHGGAGRPPARQGRLREERARHPAPERRSATPARAPGSC